MSNQTTVVATVEIRKWEVVFLDDADRPMASYEIAAEDYWEACGIAHKMNPNAPDFQIHEVTDQSAN